MKEHSFIVMHNKLHLIDKYLFFNDGIAIDGYCENEVNQNYAASSFKLEEYICIFREAKVTPKKLGNFVVIWKRSLEDKISSNVTIPYNVSDFDLCFVFVEKEMCCGVFIFPNTILQLKNIISSKSVSGKRGFRLYPKWDILTNKQALDTQSWQLEYFIDFTDVNKIDSEKFKKIVTQKNIDWKNKNEYTPR